MILKVDRLPIELPQPTEPDSNAAAAVQELLGGKFGEMSTFMNYTFQSFNFRGKSKFRPFYDLIASIGGEEYGHLEIVSAGINLLHNGPREDGDADNLDPASSPAIFEAFKEMRNTQSFIMGGGSALPQDSMGKPWTGENVFASGNLMLDLTHNFFLESGARKQKLRVYEMTDNPAAREMIGYLLVRGGVHQLAYAKALEALSGVEIAKMLPMPNIPTAKIPESKKLIDRGEHLKLYRYSETDFHTLAATWNGTHPEDGKPLVVADQVMPEGAPQVPLADLKPAFVPDYETEEIEEIAKVLMKKAEGF